MLNVPLTSKPVVYLPADTLQVGDALLFEHRIHQSVVVRGIRLVTGSKFVHVGTVEDPLCSMLPTAPPDPVVMEQLITRTFERVALYLGAPAGTVVHALRPKFPIEPLDMTLLERSVYGYLGIADCLLNHGIGLIPGLHWRHRAMLGLLTPNHIVCSALAAKRYRLYLHTDWAPDYRVVEPDQFYNHSESFDYLGRVSFPSLP